MRAIYLLALVGCVKGNPVDLGEFHGTGGTLAIEGCGYSVTTREGAEPPAKGIDLIGPDPTPKLVHLGIIGDPKTSVVAVWRTNDELTRVSTIRFAAGDHLQPADLTQEGTGIVFGYQSGGADGVQHVYPVHQGHLCGLQPGTTYSYQVGSVDPFTKAEHFSPVYTFHTAPDLVAHPDAEVVLGFVGDSRGGYDIWSEMIQQLLSRTPDIVLFSGDAVTLGITQPEWEDFFGRAEPLFATTPMISAHGNHEANAINYYSQMALPGDEQNYGIDYGYAHITVANDTPEDPNAITGAFRDALQADFAASQSARWKIFMHHQPMWSASTRHGSSLTLQQAWQPLVDQYGIDLVLNGHDHDYEVTLPMLGAATQPSSATGTVYIVAGSAGAELYDNGTDFWTAYSEKTYSAATIQVRRDRMTFAGFRQDGTAIPTGFDKSKP
jgi:calcineurin-like phosphoesterase family protein/purple acid phosphatase-like protein